MTEIFTTDYPLTNIAPGSQAYIECGQGGQLYVRSSSHDQFTLNIEGVGTLIGHSGLQVRGVEARKIEVRNNGADPLALVINIGSAEIIDRRASVSEILRVHDPVGGESFGNIVDAMNNSELQRNGLSELGTSYFGVRSASGVYTVLDPSLNTNGAILRYAGVYCWGAGGYVFADTSAPGAAYDFTKRVILGSDNSNTSVTVKDISLAAGIGIYAGLNSVNGAIAIGYEVL